MKKRNRVLEVILCATLAVVVFWGYMLAARDNGVFALEDIEGDRTALNAFAFEGLAGDDNGQIYYTWQNGELKTKYYAATDDEMRYIIRQERDGSKGISRYFKKRSLARSEYFSDTEFAPAKDANVRRLSGLEDLSESAREYLGEYFDGDTVQGVTADALDVYGKVKNYTSGETRFFTGLQLKGGEYQAAKVKEGDTTYQSSWFDGRNEVILCTVKMDDAWYAIPQTGADGQGEVSIFRIPKDGMADIPYSGEDALYSTKQYGKAESLQTFSVNAENRQTLHGFDLCFGSICIFMRYLQNIFIFYAFAQYIFGAHAACPEACADYSTRKEFTPQKQNARDPFVSRLALKEFRVSFCLYAPEKGPPAALHARHSSSFCALGSFLSAASRRRALRLSAQRST